MSKLFLIGLAGFIGTLGRYWLSGVVAKRYGETFPMGTLVVNLTGCFLVGLLFYVLEERFLAAPSVVGLTVPKARPLLRGVDDARHYSANVQAYRRALRSRAL